MSSIETSLYPEQSKLLDLSQNPELVNYISTLEDPADPGSNW